jgi:hypothetical protein
MPVSHYNRGPHRSRQENSIELHKNKKNANNPNAGPHAFQQSSRDGNGGQHALQFALLPNHN